MTELIQLQYRASFLAIRINSLLAAGASVDILEEEITAANASLGPVLSKLERQHRIWEFSKRLQELS